MHRPHHLSTPLVLLLLGCRGDTSESDTAQATDSTGPSATTAGSPDPSATADSDSTTTDPSPTETTEATCGDGIVDDDEACDDGINDGEYGGCMPDCTALAPRCGDGTIDPQWHERCDHGAANGDTECNRWCQLSGTKLGELSLAPSGDRSVLTRAASGRLFVATEDPNALWELASRPDGALEAIATTSLESVLESPNPPSAIAEFGSDRIALAEGQLDAHILHVLDVSDPSAAVWSWSSHASVAPLTGVTTDLLALDSQLWMIGSAASNGPLEQQLWVHRFELGGSTRAAHDVDSWQGSGGALGPQAVFDPTSGYVALFTAHAGAVLEHMRMSVRDPRTGQEISSAYDYDYDYPRDACTRPDGGLLVLASEAGTPSHRLALGYRIDGDGVLVQDGEVDLVSGSSFFDRCVAGSDTIALLGRSGGLSSVIAVADFFGPTQRITWQYGPVYVGLVGAGHVFDGIYHDGRFFVAVGDDPTGVVVGLAGVVALAE